MLLIEPLKPLKIRLSDEYSIQEFHLLWYDSKSQEVNSSRQIVTVSYIPSFMISTKNSNTMAYQLLVNTPILYGDDDPKKIWFVYESLWKANLIDDESQ